MRRAACVDIAERLKRRNRLERDKAVAWISDALEPTGSVGDLFLDWDEARRLARRGFEIGSHSMYHAILSQETPQDQALDLKTSRQLLEDQLDVRVARLAYPNGTRKDYDEATVAGAQASGHSDALTLIHGPNGATAYLAHLGHEVVCADVVRDKVERLNRGEIPIVEAGLEGLVREGLAQDRLTFVLGAANAVAGAEFVFLCLPTPQGEDGSADLSYVQVAAAEIAPHLMAGAVVINKSTVPVGSVEMVADIIGRSDVAVVSNPEFLREGTAVHDCLHPDRIVIGSDDRVAAERVAALFSVLDAPVLITDAASAETIKYASNAFLAAKISFINAIANLCEAVGADVTQVAQGMALDSRIGSQFLNPGPGWGGSCFPKDTKALVRIAEDAGYDFMLLRGVIEANVAQHEVVVHKIERMAGGSLAGLTVAAWGLAFKAGTDDLRDSPALAIIRQLRTRGASVQAFDPAVARPLDGIQVVSDPYRACESADVLVVLTEWPLFAELDMVKVREVMTTPRVVDARNLLNPAYASMLGFAYEGIGRQGWIDPSELDNEVRDLADAEDAA